MRILIIKTGYSETFRPDLTYAAISYGDILRTTPILHLFKKDQVHWLTDIKAVPLLFGIKKINTIHLVNTLDVLGLESYTWDMIVNLENSRGACLLAEKLMSTHTKLIGYYFSRDKQKIFTDAHYSGENWSEKLFSIFSKQWKGEPYLVPHKKITPKKNLVFLNRTVGPKLPSKKWDGWDDLKSKLESEGMETTQQKSLKIEDFISEIQEASYMISTDSLGLHIALALGRPVLGLFGPSSAKEIPGLSFYIQEKNLKNLRVNKVHNTFNAMRKSNEA
jgi:heptosyltransferase-2